MPATIGDILTTKPELSTTTPETLLFEAIDQMIRYDYSQLPVLNGAGKPIGMLTSDSIVRALHHFGVVAREPKDDKERARHLRVRDAMYHQAEKCSPEDEVFVVHRQLRDVNSVLVLDDDDKLIGIVTGYDTTEYLRQRVQDIVFVQDIEERIKDYIKLAFRQADGNEDKSALQSAIGVRKITGSPAAQKFKQLLNAYLKRKEGLDVQFDEEIADQVLLSAEVPTQEIPREFDELTLSTYVDLFLKHGLKRYGHVFQLDRSTLFQMLDSVRQTRNSLAHLKIDISARARDELRHCREWLKNYYDDARAVVTPGATAETTAPATETVPTTPLSDYDARTLSGDTIAVDEEVTPSEGRYAKLADWLFSFASDQDRITVSFGQIEKIIGGKLPPSAREYRSWWANDTSRYRHSGQWLSAGWRTDEVDVGRGRVTFNRLQERERAYSAFFEALLNDLRRVATFSLYQPTKVGYYWQSITKVPTQSNAIGYLTFAFTRAQRPRVDLYIDTSDQARNKAIFDALFARREAIEFAFGQALTWERIDEKRASRIASYYDSSTTIHSSPDELTALRIWGVDALVRLYNVLEPSTREVLTALDTEQPTPAIIE